eukprot:1160788-Pelagomonas_calceolata.AAC.2
MHVAGLRHVEGYMKEELMIHARGGICARGGTQAYVEGFMLAGSVHAEGMVHREGTTHSACMGEVNGEANHGQLILGGEGTHISCMLCFEARKMIREDYRDDGVHAHDRKSNCNACRKRKKRST